MMDPESDSSPLIRVFFFPIRWKSKKVFEQVSPYLSQLVEVRCQFCATLAWKISASSP